MGNLNKLGIGLTVIFILSLVALSAELCYIFLRRRRRNGERQSEISGETYSSRELLYFFCCRKTSSIELAGTTTTIHPVDDDNVVVEQQDELAKWQEMYGPSRILFTIKEEEKEDLESEKSSSERKSKLQGFSGLLEEQEKATVVIGLENEGTETPYYTPSASPIHEVQRGVRNLSRFGEDGDYFVVEVEKL